VFAALAVRPPATSGPFARDFEAYYAAGAVWDRGGDPYSRDVWRVERTVPGVDATRDELLPYVGPAAALPIFGALARVPWAAAVAVWTAALSAAFVGLMLAALAAAGIAPRTRILAALLFGIAAGPLISDIALGQAALLAAAGVACAAFAYGRSVAGGVLATFVAGLQPNLGIVLIARLRDRASLIAAGGGALLFAVVTFAAGGGLPGLEAYVQRLAAHGSVERFAAIQQTPAAVLWSFGVAPRLAQLLGSAFAGLVIVTLIAIIVRRRIDAFGATLLACAALPLVVPFFHEHDFVLLLVPLVALGAAATGPTRVLTGIAATATMVDWLALAQRPAGAPQAIALAIALACAFAAMGRNERVTRSDLAPFVTAALLLAIAIPLGHAHPAPTWPDALGAYHAPQTADATAVWSAEQKQSGIVRREPAWGILRTIPLLGCVVLCFAAARYRRS
jgi:hypothetical protein